MSETPATTSQRHSPLEMSADEFRAIGHRLIDQLAERLTAIPAGPVVRDESPADVRAVISQLQSLPSAGSDAGQLVTEAVEQLFDHSLFNGHPRFFGYITSSPAPIGILAELLAAALNQNVGAWRLSPLATEIEVDTVRWIADLVGFPTSGSGLLVSGGNMANFVAFAAARAAKGPADLRTKGVSRDGRMVVYASAETHTWIQKAADLFGLGTDAIHWIPCINQQMDVDALRQQVTEDTRRGLHPLLVVGTAGSVGTGAVDPLPDIAAVCSEHGLWFHVDGAYGAFAAGVPGAPAALAGIAEADSVAVDPHKWLYAPLEAGCTLVRDVGALRHAFSYHPPYYQFDESVVNYYDLGPQNSRGFRALKVWLALRHVGRDGYQRMIRDDMALARRMYELAAHTFDLEATSQNLSITTFRFVPADLRSRTGTADVESYLNELNREVLSAVEKSGAAFLSNAVIDGRFVLRACIVNFHTSQADVEALIRLVSDIGQRVDPTLRSRAFAASTDQP